LVACLRIEGQKKYALKGFKGQKNMVSEDVKGQKNLRLERAQSKKKLDQRWTASSSTSKVQTSGMLFNQVFSFPRLKGGSYEKI
jgi:hypothetical protein